MSQHLGKTCPQSQDNRDFSATQRTYWNRAEIHMVAYGEHNMMSVQHAHLGFHALKHLQGILPSS